jgi:N-acetylglucosaminyldiphosphoundecaprenol N-acetyl-beta-D-mannosaminyltransferase
MVRPLVSAKIGNIKFNPCTRSEALDHIFEMAELKTSRFVVTSNADHLLRASEDREFAHAVANSDFVVSDGWPIVATLRAMGFPNAERVTGADLLPAISQRCAKTGKTIFIMGGMEGWADKAAENLKASYPGLKVAGTYFPPFGFEKNQETCKSMVNLINECKPDFLFVGVGAPKQELWIHNFRPKFHCGVAMGVGMAIGFVAEAIPRAPKILQKLGLEWFFRMFSEPRRLAPRYAKDLLIIPSLVRAILGRQ